MKTKKEGFKKALSVFLSMLLIYLTFSVSMPVFAYEFETDDNNISNISESEDVSLKIISEIDYLREENVKHFKMSDGSYRVAVYANPVHYKENGEWKEIDSRIKENKSASRDAQYYAVVEDAEFLFPGKISDGNRLTVKKDGYEVSFGYKNEGISVFSSSEILDSSDSKISIPTDSTTEIYDDYLISNGVIRYNNASASTDIEYELNSSMLKESIIVSDRQTEYIYKFSLDTGSLIPVVNNDGAILLVEKNKTDKPEFVIAPPFMTDAKGIFSDNVNMTLTRTADEYILTVTADKEWLNSPDREFPVVIDPTLLYRPDRTEDIFDTYIDSATPSTTHYLSTYSIVGYNSLGTGRAYLKFNLPSLPHCGVITNATLGLIQMGYDPGNGVNNHMVVYESPSPQNYQTLTWNNQPSLTSQPVVDYTAFRSGDNGSVFYTLDITKIAKNWFENGINNGLFIASANESSSWRSTIYTSNYTGYDAYPMISISYIDNKGLENYWSYETVDMGRSGTVYINEYNGLLTYVHTDIALGGNVASLTASHIYSNDYAAVGTPYGYGFRVSSQENISVISSGELYDEGYRAFLTDADGTAHYFKYVDSSTMKYEFDDNLILKKVSGQSYLYELQYEDGSKRRYDSSGKLLSSSDRNGNTVTYTYDSNGRISYITDAIGRKITYTYDSAGYLSKTTDAADRNTTYTYKDGYLQTITYPDGKTTVLSYISGRLFNIKQADSTNVSFLYQSADRVDFISIKGTDATVLKNVNLYYKGSNTEIKDSMGRSITVGFDNMGRAISRADKEGNIVTAEYNTGGNINNTLAGSSDTFSFSDSMLLNHSFESGYTGWTNSLSSGTTSYSVVTAQKYIGAKALKLAVSSEGKIVASQDITDFEVGKEYTFSAYVKATAMSDGETAVRIEGKNSSGTVTAETSQWISSVTDGWTRLQVSYTVPSGVTYLRICLELQGSSGTVYYDALQCEEASGAGHYNLLINPGFERNASNAFSGWTSAGTVASVTGTVNSSASVRISGLPSSNARLVQSVNIGTSSKNRTLIFGGSAKGNCAASGNTESSSAKFGFLLEAYSGTSLVSSKYALYNTYAIDTVQFLSDCLTANSSVDSVKLYLLYDKNVNTAYFDNVFLYIDNFGTTYEYNDDGKIIKQSNNAGDAISYTYSGVDITKISITKDGEEKDSYTYTYDAKHNLLTETTKSGIITMYTYPSSGNVGMPTSVVVKNSDGSLKSSVTYTYMLFYNYISKVTDARGNSESYFYNSNKDLLVSYTDKNGAVTRYVYNSNNDELVRVYTTVGSETVDVNYSTNSNGQLSSITQDGVSYNFTYDVYGRRTSTKVGSQSLATYTYNSRGLLGSTTYGNGTVHTLTYDESDRIISEAYNGTASASYAYNTEGYLGKMTDHGLGVTTYYGYDLVGRITDVDSSDGVSSDFSYNEYNSIASYSVKKNNSVISEADYTYNTDGLLTGVATNNGTYGSFTYSYDALNRKYLTTHPVSGSAVNTVYLYTAGTNSDTTGLVSMIGYMKGNSQIMPSLGYTYDNNGNIAAITKNAAEHIRYTYDSLDRLVREDNKDLNETVVYTYDKRGNILSKKYYNYTTGTVGALIDEITYAYDSTWKDKLVNYDGQSISYDTIGNPTEYGGLSFNWQKGRQLSSIEMNDIEVMSFSYNAEGLRTEKHYFFDDEPTTYTWSSGLLMQQSDGTNTLKFSYSPDGKALGVIFNGTSYYYIYNLQGDVIGLYDSSGNVVVEYTYDSWGKLLDTTGSLSSTLGRYNPFRYRGYIYDEETALYYLRSRYYDPETCRFINADGLIDNRAISTQNMFSYCANNPVMNIDISGAMHVRGIDASGGAGNCSNRSSSEAVLNETMTNEDKNNIKNNTSEIEVINADFYSYYKGVFVLKLPIGENAFSFGIMFIGNDVHDINDIKHEYGHALQFQELGIIDYTRYVGIPSLKGFWTNAPNYYSQPWEYGADLYGGVDKNERMYTADAEENYKIYWDSITD